MTDEPLTYGPDMFYSDVTLPDPTTVLNEPLPRAWSQGGMIEAVKRAVITGLRESFGNSSLGAGEQKYYIDIEYPTDPTSYPGIWVQFSIASLTRAGLAMETWTKDADDNWGSIQEWSFNGNISLTIAALTSKDRDRLADREHNRDYDDKLEGVIREQGIREPVHISTNGTHAILNEGNHRLDIAQKLGIPEIPARIFVDDKVIRGDNRYGKPPVPLEPFLKKFIDTNRGRLESFWG